MRSTVTWLISGHSSIIEALVNATVCFFTVSIIRFLFENPFEIKEEHFDKEHNYSDDDEFMISEDMIGDIKKLVLETFNPNIVRQTNEIPTPNLMK